MWEKEKKVGVKQELLEIEAQIDQINTILDGDLFLIQRRGKLAWLENKKIRFSNKRNRLGG